MSLKLQWFSWSSLGTTLNLLFCGEFDEEVDATFPSGTKMSYKDLALREKSACLYAKVKKSVEMFFLVQQATDETRAGFIMNSYNVFVFCLFAVLRRCTAIQNNHWQV